MSEPVKTVGEEGGSCQLDCQFRGEPTPVITWLLNGESVYNDSLIKTNGKSVSINYIINFIR